MKKIFLPMLAIVSLFGMVGTFSASAFADRVPDGEEYDVLVRLARVARQWDDEKSEWVEKGVIDFETKVFKSRGNRKEDLVKIEEMIKEQKIYYFGGENFFFDEKSEIKQPEECDEHQVYTVLPSKIDTIPTPPPAPQPSTPTPTLVPEVYTEDL